MTSKAFKSGDRFRPRGGYEVFHSTAHAIGRARDVLRGKSFFRMWQLQCGRAVSARVALCPNADRDLGPVCACDLLDRLCRRPPAFKEISTEPYCFRLSAWFCFSMAAVCSGSSRSRMVRRRLGSKDSRR